MYIYIYCQFYYNIRYVTDGSGIVEIMNKDNNKYLNFENEIILIITHKVFEVRIFVIRGLRIPNYSTTVCLIISNAE